MNVLVIGGTGFIGARVVRRLADAGHAVAVFHRGEAPDYTAEDAALRRSR